MLHPLRLWMMCYALQQLSSLPARHHFKRTTHTTTTLVAAYLDGDRQQSQLSQGRHHRDRSQSATKLHDPLPLLMQQGPASACPAVLHGDDAQPVAAAAASSWWQRLSSLRVTALAPYHLLFAPKALLKAVTTACVLLLLSTSNVWTTHMPRFSTPASSCHSAGGIGAASNVVLPLLASACCILQLALNALSVGCAGFNTYLGPARPYFVGVLLYATFTSSSSSPWWLHTLRWSLALLPEALHVWNNMAKVPIDAINIDNVHVVQLEIPSMGCVACINSIEGSLQRQPHIVQVEAALHAQQKGGYATVHVVAADDHDVAAVVTNVQAAIAKAGFGSNVQSIVRRPPELKSAS